MLPALIAVSALLIVEIHQHREQRQSGLEHSSRWLADAIGEFVRNHQHALGQTAQSLDRSACSDRDCLAVMLDALRHHHPAVLTALATDANARVLAFSTARHDAPALDALSLVDDRSYFAVPRATEQAFVSEVFRGRGLGDDIIVALAHPRRNTAGEFDGVVQATLGMDQLRARITPLALTAQVGRNGADRSLQLILVDAEGRVIQDSSGRREPLSRLEDCPMQAVWTVDRAGRCTDANGASWSYVPTLVPGTSWYAISISADAQLWSGMLGYLVSIGLAIVLTALVVAIAAEIVASRLSLPLERMVEHLSDLDLHSSDATPRELIDDPRAPAELRAIGDSVHQLSQRLASSYQQLQEALDDKDRASRRLAETLDQREQYIAEQTGKIKDALASAEQAGRAKDELLANTSHEMRTPLNGVIGAAELALSETSDPALRQRIQMILDSAEGLLALINDILDLSRIGSGGIVLNRAAMAPRAEVEACMTTLMPVASRRGLQLELVADDLGAEWRCGDALRLRQVLLNLMSNAVKFTDRGGVKVRIQALDDERMRFEVEDSGIGIPPEVQERIFEPFFQVDASAARWRSGSGLGLAISRRLAEQMGGQLAVSSEPGHGSCFTLELPLPRTEAPAAPLRVEHIGTNDTQGALRVLVVDDVQTNCDILIAQLSALGAEASGACDGFEALAVVGRQRFDLILVDLQMPGMDGHELARRLRRREDGQSLRLVALTANAQPGERERCLASGMDDYQTKPIRLKTLRAVLMDTERIPDA